MRARIIVPFVIEVKVSQRSWPKFEHFARPNLPASTRTSMHMYVVHAGLRDTITQISRPLLIELAEIKRRSRMIMLPLGSDRLLACTTGRTSGTPSTKNNWYSLNLGCLCNCLECCSHDLLISCRYFRFATHLECKYRVNPFYGILIIFHKEFYIEVWLQIL